MTQKRIVLSFGHGTGGDADDRQGNEARHGDVAGFLLGRRRYAASVCSAASSLG